MLEEIEEASTLLEKAENESDIMEKGFLIEEAMDILDKCSDDDKLGAMARNIKEKHIKIFLDQIVELPIRDGDDVMDVVEIVESMGKEIFDIVENDMETYRAAAEKLANIFLNYNKIIKDLEEWQRNSRLRVEKWRKDFEKKKHNIFNDDPIV